MASPPTPGATPPASPTRQASVRWLMGLNVTIADVQNGMGPYVALFLQSSAQWNPAQIGGVLALGNAAQLLAQTPAGIMIDQLRQKRALLLAAIALIVIACIATPLWPITPVVAFSQILVGVAGAIFPPALAAVALGLVGRARLDRQMGTNQACNAAGNCLAALALGAVGYWLSLEGMFYLVVVLAAVSAFIVLRIRGSDIDYWVARGADTHHPARPEERGADPHSSLRGLLADCRELLRHRAVKVFLACAVLFHFANAAMVPLVTQMLGQSQGAQQAVLYTSGYMVASQAVFIVVAAFSGRLAATVGRKPLFLFAFAVLALRGVLYTLSDKPAVLIAVQCLDGLGAGVFGVVAVLVIADLTKGTARFNAAQGAVATAQGLGALLSNVVGGLLAQHHGTTAGFLFLAAVAAAGLVLYAVGMPETLDRAGPEADAAPPTGTALT